MKEESTQAEEEIETPAISMKAVECEEARKNEVSEGSRAMEEREWKKRQEVEKKLVLQKLRKEEKKEKQLAMKE